VVSAPSSSVSQLKRFAPKLRAYMSWLKSKAQNQASVVVPAPQRLPNSYDTNVASYFPDAASQTI